MIERHKYGYDAQNRRTTDLWTDGSRWNYGYNARSEVMSAFADSAQWTDDPRTAEENQALESNAEQFWLRL